MVIMWNTEDWEISSVISFTNLQQPSHHFTASLVFMAKAAVRSTELEPCDKCCSTSYYEHVGGHPLIMNGKEIL